jgi:hypothetical protein
MWFIFANDNSRKCASKGKSESYTSFQAIRSIIAMAAPLFAGRQLVPATSDIHEIHELAGKECVSVLTYNIMRQMHATSRYKPFCDDSLLTATRRKDQLLEYV